MPTKKTFDQFLIFVNLYQQARIQNILSIFSGDIINLKIPRSHWLRAFWPTSQEQDFSQT